MRKHDYQKACLRTLAEPIKRELSPEMDAVLHGAIGLSGEVSEIFASEDADESNIPEEVGDALWYVAIVLFGMGYDLEDMEHDSLIAGIDDPYRELVIHSGNVLDEVKRAIYYGAPVTGRFLVSIQNCLACLDLIAAEHSTTLEDCMERNIVKLKIRYPEKFDALQAINRNTKHEAQAFAD